MPRLKQIKGGSPRDAKRGSRTAARAFESWASVSRSERQQIYRFAHSALVLAFALRARQLAAETAVVAEVRENFGKVTVTAQTDGRNSHQLSVFAASLNWAADAIREERDEWAIPRSGLSRSRAPRMARFAVH